MQNPIAGNFTTNSRATGLQIPQFMDVEWFQTQSTLADDLGIPLNNRFACLLNAPSFPEFRKNGWLELQVLQVETPDFQIDPQTIELNGINRFYFKQRIDSDLSITFLESSDLVIRRFFYSWMNEAVTVNPNKSDSIVKRKYLKDYTASEMIVTPLSYDGTAYYGDRFIDVFPFHIHGIEYNKGQSNEIIKTTVVFKYLVHQMVSVSEREDSYHASTTLG